MDRGVHRFPAAISELRLPWLQIAELKKAARLDERLASLRDELPELTSTAAAVPSSPDRAEKREELRALVTLRRQTTKSLQELLTQLGALEGEKEAELSRLAELVKEKETKEEQGAKEATATVGNGDREAKRPRLE